MFLIYLWATVIILLLIKRARVISSTIAEIMSNPFRKNAFEDMNPHLLPARKCLPVVEPTEYPDPPSEEPQPVAGYRINTYKHVEEKEPVMKARYRRMSFYSTRIIFQYKLAGQWFWLDASISVLNEKTFDDAEKSVKRWLEFHSREGIV